jgi:hypothetical protein
MLLMSYFMLIIGHFKVTDSHYIIMNVVGALFIIITLHMGGTLPMFYTIMAWMLISVFGFYRHHIAAH